MSYLNQTKQETFSLTKTPSNKTFSFSVSKCRKRRRPWLPGQRNMPNLPHVRSQCPLKYVNTFNIE